MRADWPKAGCAAAKGLRFRPHGHDQTLGDLFFNFFAAAASLRFDDLRQKSLRQNCRRPNFGRLTAAASPDKKMEKNENSLGLVVTMWRGAARG